MDKLSYDMSCVLEQLFNFNFVAAYILYTILSINTKQYPQIPPNWSVTPFPLFSG